MQFNQTNNNTGTVNNSIQLGSPEEGALLITTSQEISAAEMARIRDVWERSRRSGVLVCDADTRAFQFTGGKWVEITASKPN